MESRSMPLPNRRTPGLQRCSQQIWGQGWSLNSFISWSPYFGWKFRGQFLGFLVTSTHHMMPSIMLTKHKNMMMLVVCGGIVDGHGLPQWEVEYCGGGWMAGSCWVLRAIFLKRNGQRLWVCLGLRVTPLSHCALIQVVKPQGCPTFGKGCC